MTHHRTRTQMLLRSYIYFILVCLTGCMGVYEGGFECAAEKGVGCQSISQVNQMIDDFSSTESSCSQCEKAEIWYAPPFEFHQEDPIKKGRWDAKNAI